MTSEFELTHQALDAAETMLRCLPQVSTNAKGTKPNMTTTEALKLVRAALAQHSVADPRDKLIDEVRWVAGRFKAHRHSIEAGFERLKTGANVHAVNSAKFAPMDYLHRIQKKFDEYEGTSPATEGDGGADEARQQTGKVVAMATRKSKRGLDGSTKPDPTPVTDGPDRQDYR